MNTKNGYVSCLNANNKIPLPQSTQKKKDCKTQLILNYILIGT